MNKIFVKTLYFFDLIVSFGSNGVIPYGYLLIENGQIQEIGLQSEIKENLNSISENYQIIQLKNSICLPGFINSHIHISYTNNYSPVKNNEQIDWIKNLVFESRNFSSENKKQIAQNNIDKVINSGTTFIVENTPFDESIDLINKSKIKALIGLEVFGNNDSLSQQIFEKYQAKLLELEEKYTSKNISFTFSPHSIYNVSIELMKKLSKWSIEHKKKLLIHLAEFDFESDLTHLGYPSIGLSELYKLLNVSQICLNSIKNITPIKYLDSIDCLNDNLLATHLTKASNDDFKLIAKNKVNIISCPRSNAFLNNGVLNFNTIKNNNLKVVYGTDGLSSNSDLDILNEIKSTWSIFKSHGFDISAEDLFRGITFDAAKILGLEKEIGSLEENKKADFVSFELSEEKISIVLKMLSNNSDSIYQFLLTELNSSFINGVWIDGEKVK